MATIVGQRNYSGGSPVTTRTSASFEVQQGDLIVAQVKWEDADRTVVVKDTDGNRYGKALRANNSTSVFIEPHWAIAQSNAVITVTANLGASTNYAALYVVVCRPSTGKTFVLDASNTDLNSSGAPSTAALSVSGAGFAMFGFAEYSTWSTITAGAGWTGCNDKFEGVGGSWCAYRILTNESSIVGSATTNGNFVWAAYTCAWKEVDGATQATATFVNTNGTSLTAHDSQWVVNTGAATIQGNAVTGNAATNSLARRSGSWDAAQWAEAVIADPQAGGGTAGVAVRVASGAVLTAYSAEVGVSAGDKLYVSKYVNGSYTALNGASGASVTANEGSVLRLEVSGVGSTVTLRAYLDGVQVGADITDTAADRLLSGSPGLSFYDNNQYTFVKSWRAGSAGAVLERGAPVIIRSRPSSKRLLWGDPVVRYHLDDNPPSDPTGAGYLAAPSFVRDYGPGGYHLNAISVEGVQYFHQLHVCDRPGHRGWRSDSVTGVQRLARRVVSGDWVDRALSGGRKFTVEFVMNVTSVTFNNSRFFVLNKTAGENPTLGLASTAYNSSRFWWNEGGGDSTQLPNWGSVAPLCAPIQTYHLVYDTTLGSERGKIYVNGKIHLSSSTGIAQDTVLQSLAGHDLIFFNRLSGTAYDRSFEGQMFYGAVYAEAFTPKQCEHNAGILLRDSNAPRPERRITYSFPSYAPPTKSQPRFKSVGYYATNAGGSPVSVTLAGVNRGDTIVGRFFSYADPTGWVVSDNRGNSYQVFPIEPTQLCDFDFCTVAGSDGDLTVTVSLTNSPTYKRLIVAAYEGCGSLDGYAILNSTPAATTDAATSGSVTTAVDGELVVGIYGNTTNDVYATAGTGFTERFKYLDGAGDSWMLEDKIQTTKGAVAATFTPGQASLSTRVSVFTFRPGIVLTAPAVITRRFRDQGAMAADANSGYLYTASVPSETSWSACGWFSWDGANIGTSQWGYTLGFDDASSNGYDYIELRNPGSNPYQLTVFGAGSSATSWDADIANITYKQPFFVALTRSGDIVTAYHRGWDQAALASASYNRVGFGYTSAIARFRVFQSPYTDEGWFGRGWDVRVWNRVLSASELLLESRSRSVYSRRGLHLHWKMRGRGDMVDVSGNGRHPVLSGTVYNANTPSQALRFADSKRILWHGAAAEVQAPTAWKRLRSLYHRLRGV